MRNKPRNAKIILFALIIIVSLFLQSRLFDEFIALKESASALSAFNAEYEARLNKNADEIISLKKALSSSRRILPRKVISPLHFYSLVKSAMNSSQITGTKEIKSQREANIVTLNLSGRDDYRSLLNFLLLLRQSPYRFRVSKVEFSYADGLAEYAVAVQSQVEVEKALTSPDKEILRP